MAPVTLRTTCLSAPAGVGSLPRRSRSAARSVRAQAEKEEVTFSSSELVSAEAAKAAAAAAPAAAAAAAVPKQSFGEIFGFKGWAPERLNGRLSMLGFVSGVGAELQTNESVVNQFSDHLFSFVFASALITLASFMPSMQNTGDYKSNPATKSSFPGPFTPSAEMLNGRAAMIGMAALLAVEALKGGPLF